MPDSCESPLLQRRGKTFESYFLQQTLNSFITNHPTTAKDRLMNKIFANWMISCADKISKEQVLKLHEFRDNPQDFDITNTDYLNLLNYDLDQYKPQEGLTEEQQAEPIELNQEEIFMQTIVEDLSEEMKREQEEDIKSQRGSAQLFGFDLQDMSSQASLLYVGALFAFFGIVFYYLLNKLFTKPVSMTKQKRLNREAKRNTPKKEKTNWIYD